MPHSADRIGSDRRVSGQALAHLTACLIKYNIHMADAKCIKQAFPWEWWKCAPPLVGCNYLCMWICEEIRHNSPTWQHMHSLVWPKISDTPFWYHTLTCSICSLLYDPKSHTPHWYHILTCFVYKREWTIMSMCPPSVSHSHMLCLQAREWTIMSMLLRAMGITFSHVLFKHEQSCQCVMCNFILHKNQAFHLSSLFHTLERGKTKGIMHRTMPTNTNTVLKGN